MARTFDKETIDLINNVFGGSEERYLRALKKGQNEVIDWETIADSVNIFPELEKNAERLIEIIFGYAIESRLTIPYEAYIRGLINNYRLNIINKEKLVSMAEESLRPLRNIIVNEHATIKYHQSVYYNYNSLPVEYKERIKERFNKFLGYEPDIGSSIVCENNLCKYYARDYVGYPEQLTGYDYQAFTVIKYREVFLAYGKERADISPIPIIDIKLRNNCLESF